MDEEIVQESEDAIDVCVGVAEWRTPDGLYVLEKDYRVGGEVWRVHKFDADPFPSRPHAHCVAGAKRFIGCKLHLGTAELYKGAEAQGRYLDPVQFNRLIACVRRKFPELTLPIPSPSN